VQDHPTPHEQMGEVGFPQRCQSPTSSIQPLSQ
jgi:hypothetical protein